MSAWFNELRTCGRSRVTTAMGSSMLTVRCSYAILGSLRPRDRRLPRRQDGGEPGLVKIVRQRLRGRAVHVPADPHTVRRTLDQGDRVAQRSEPQGERRRVLPRIERADLDVKPAHFGRYARA